MNICDCQRDDRLVCIWEGQPLAVRRPAQDSEQVAAKSGFCQLALGTAKRGHDVNSVTRFGGTRERDERSIWRPSRHEPGGRMFGQATRNFAAKLLHVQIKSIARRALAAVPREGNLVAIRGETGVQLLPWISCKRDNCESVGLKCRFVL